MPTEHRKKGVFRKLYDHVVGIARSTPNTKCVRLYVETTNETAMTVYEKMGMHNIAPSYNFHEIDYVWVEQPKVQRD